jgi:hypothetical protein
MSGSVMPVVIALALEIDITNAGDILDLITAAWPSAPMERSAGSSS